MVGPRIFIDVLSRRAQNSAGNLQNGHPYDILNNIQMLD